MVKLNRTTEYGIMAISYIRNKENGAKTTAREISEEFKLPFEILAKTLQRLKEQGIISSTYGTRGGYVLSHDLKKLNLLQYMQLMEGNVGVVSCVSHEQTDQHSCEYSNSCKIKPAMNTLNDRMYGFLSRISLDELTQTPIKETNNIFAGEEP